MSASTEAKSYERLYQLAVKDAKKNFGTGWEHIGGTFQKALIANSILYIVSIQDEEAPAETIRAMVLDMRRRLITEYIERKGDLS